MTAVGAVRAELRKLLSVRALLAFPLGSVLYAVLAFGPAFTVPEGQRDPIEPDALVHVLRGPGFVLAVAMLVLGALMSAGEFRHGTVASTLLVVPKRRRVLAAKVAAVAIVGALTALAVEAVALSLGVVLLQANDVASTASVADIVLSVAAVVAVAALYGAVGAGLGLAVRDQTAAVGAALLWVGIVEGAVPIVLRMPWLFKWLPGGAANAVLGVADPPGDLLAAWAGLLILVGVASAAAAAGAVLFAARDV